MTKPGTRLLPGEPRRWAYCLTNGGREVGRPDGAACQVANASYHHIRFATAPGGPASWCTGQSASASLPPYLPPFPPNFMAAQKLKKIIITWANGDWRARIEANLRDPRFAHLTIKFCADRAESLREIADADAAWVDGFDAEMLAAGRRLKWVHFMRGGVDKSMFPELLASPVQVTCLKELFATPGAEFALMAMLMVQRRMTWGVGRPKLAQTSAPPDLTPKPQDFAGRTVAIIGLGNMGRRIAELCQAFHVNVRGSARRAPAPGAFSGSFYANEQLGEMLRDADFVVLAIPSTPGTKAFVDARLLQAFKPGAWLIDVSSRPALFDYAAVRQAVESRQLGGLMLQPCGPQSPGAPLPDDAFWQRENVIVCPSRGVSAEQEAQSVALFGENLLRLENGQPLRGVVDKAAGY
jgi:phosphoglycerate dehydrogenase-like enzyme